MAACAPFLTRCLGYCHRLGRLQIDGSPGPLQSGKISAMVFSRNTVSLTPDKPEITMYRTILAAAAFAVISVGAITTSHAQQWALPELNASTPYTTQSVPGDDMQGQSTGEEREAQELEPQDRAWVWVNSCWTRWSYVGTNWWGRAIYRRYVVCR